MQLTLLAIRVTIHGGSVPTSSVWSVKSRWASSRDLGEARAYGPTTTAVPDIDTLTRAEQMSARAVNPRRGTCRDYSDSNTNDDTTAAVHDIDYRPLPPPRASLIYLLRFRSMCILGFVWQREKIKQRSNDVGIAPTSFLWSAYYPNRYYYEVHTAEYNRKTCIHAFPRMHI